MPPYVIDFYCEALKVVIELDGSQHHPEIDGPRARYLESHGLTVLRFWDNDVLIRTDAVVEAIFNVASDRTLTPTPLPAGEGSKSDA